MPPLLLKEHGFRRAGKSPNAALRVRCTHTVTTVSGLAQLEEPRASFSCTPAEKWRCGVCVLWQGGFLWTGWFQKYRHPTEAKLDMLHSCSQT